MCARIDFCLQIEDIPCLIRGLEMLLGISSNPDTEIGRRRIDKFFQVMPLVHI